MEEFVRNETRVRVSPAHGIVPRHQRTLRDIHKCGGRALLERDVKVPLRCDPSRHADECREHGHRCVAAREHIDQCDSDLHGLAVRRPGYGHPARLGLRHEIVAGPRALWPKSTHGTPNELRMRAEQIGRAELACLEHSGAKVVDHDVGARDQSAHEFAIARRIEGGGDAQFVAIAAQEIGALAPLIERRTPGSTVIAAAGPLDLDDIGAKIAKNHRGERASKYPTQVDDLYAVKWLNHTLVSLLWCNTAARNRAASGCLRGVPRSDSVKREGERANLVPAQHLSLSNFSLYLPPANSHRTISRVPTGFRQTSGQSESECPTRILRPNRPELPPSPRPQSIPPQAHLARLQALYPVLPARLPFAGIRGIAAPMCATPWPRWLRRRRK